MTGEHDPDDEAQEGEEPEVLPGEELASVPQLPPLSELPEHVPDDWLDPKPFDPAGR